MNSIRKTKVGRRAVLKGSGAAALGAAALAAESRTADAAGNPPRWGMVMDMRKCIGCRACTVACKSENGVALGRFRTVIQEKTSGKFPDTRKDFLPIMCNHCEGNEKDGVPPCVKVCPQFPGERASYTAPDGTKIRYRSGGTYKRPDGLILVDNDQCIGCGKCIDGCPYGVRSFNPFVKSGLKPENNGIEKCDMCAHRVDNGVEPSCVNTCQGKARIFGDLNDPESHVSKLVKEYGLKNPDNVLLPEEGTRPNVFYIDPDNVMKATYTQRTKGKLDHFMDQIP